MFATLGTIFSMLPELISLVKKAIEAVQGVASQVERRKLLADMTRAIGKASAAKDTSDIENIFNPRPKP